MHSDHDLDLVIALAAGSLADPAPAEELIAACPECADTHDAYLTVRAAVAAAPTPAMTELEKRRLNHALWAELDTEPTTDTVRTATTDPARRTPWWYRVAPVAAVLAVVVGVGATLTGGDDETTFDNVAADMGGAESPEAVEPEDRSDGEESATGMLVLPETTAAGDETADTVVTFSPQAPLEITTAELEAAVAAFERQVEDGYRSEGLDQDCVGPELDGDMVVTTERVVLDGAPVLFVALGSPTEVDAVVVLHESDCTFLYDPR